MINEQGMNAVCVGNGQLHQFELGGATGALNCMHDQQAIIVGDESDCIIRRLTPLECCRLQGFPDWWCENLADENPSQEEMAFWRWVFDNHTSTTNKKPKTDKQIKAWLASEPSDSSMYRLWGNGIALPCAYDVLKGIDDMIDLEDI